MSASNEHELDLLAWVGCDSGLHFARDGGVRDVRYDALTHSCLRAAAVFAEVGVDGARVAIVVDDELEFIAALFGAWAVGASVSPIAPARVFRNSVAYESHLESLLMAAAPAAIVLPSSAPPDHVAIAKRLGVILVDPVRDAAASVWTTELGVPEVPLVQFTSGTTGVPKGVVITRSALAANVTEIARWMDWRPHDVASTWMPFYHDMGLIGTLLAPMAVGSELWIHTAYQFMRSPTRWLKHVADVGATISAMPPFGLTQITRRVRPSSLEGVRLDALRTIVVGSERLHPGVAADFLDVLAPFGLPRTVLAPAYGMAEATLAVTGHPVRTPFRALKVRRVSIKLGGTLDLAADGDTSVDHVDFASCGVPLSRTDVRIEHDGRLLGDGALGEIVVRGSSLASGIDELHTGDAGFVIDGELFVVGRLGDAINVAGRLVFADYLEHAVGEYGAAVPDRFAVLAGELAGEPTVVVLGEPGARADAAAVAAATRSHIGPARLVLIDVHARGIERTSSGKPKRRAMWDAFAAGRLNGSTVVFDSAEAVLDPEEELA